MAVDDRGGAGRAHSRSWRPLTAPRDFPPRAATVQVEVAAQSRSVSGRAVNTDNYLVVQLDRRFETLMTSFDDPHVPACYDEHGYALVVADGLGDSAAAEIASRLAVASLAHLALYFGKWNLRIDEEVAREVMHRVDRFFRYVDTMLTHADGDTPPALFRSALTALVSAGDELFVAHVGHSRAYLLRRGTLVQLTRDHTLAARRASGPLVVAGPPAAVDAGHIVINTVGDSAHAPDIDLERLPLVDGDVLLLCTNGLSDVLAPARIVEILDSEHFLDDQARALVAAAVEDGAADDVTAVLARYEIPNGNHGAP